MILLIVFLLFLNIRNPPIMPQILNCHFSATVAENKQKFSRDVAEI